MKRLITFLAAAFLSVAAFAQAYTVGGVTYYVGGDVGPGEASTSGIDVDGGRGGVASFVIVYDPDEDIVRLTIEVLGLTPLMSDKNEDITPERIYFKDGSTLKIKSGSSEMWLGDRGWLNTLIIDMASEDCFSAFSLLRSKDIKQIKVKEGKPFSLAKLGASSASVIDNMCRLMELDGAIPEGMPGKSPHHHWAIDKEYNGPLSHQIGDTLVVDGHKGVIFEVSSRGAHGKVISVEVAEPLEFFDGFHKDFGNTSYTDGMANAKAIQAISGWKRHFPALKWCTSLGPSWYLPASGELNRALGVLSMLGDERAQENSGHALHSTYGYFSLNIGDIDFDETNPKQQLYSPLPVYAVAAF
ncbi:MAG: hypothetical protein J6X25_01185 [Bacteroidales bacterium]|nr:hypothetical protein [Bacteroidales bacterium]